MRGVKRRARLTRRGRVSAKDFLVMDLATTFEKHFGLAATVLGPSAETPPFIAFVLAVCIEQDIPMTAAEASDIGRQFGLPEDGGEP